MRRLSYRFVFPSIIAFACLAALPALTAQAQPTPAHFDQTAKQAVRHWLIPGLETFVKEAKAFDHKSGVLCASPSTSTHSAALKALQDLQLSWAAVSQVTFGPASQNKRQYRAYFWPDKHGTGARQFRKFMAAADVNQLDAKSFPQLSVALQGLGPAERLLADKDYNRVWQDGGKPEQRAFSCAYLQSIARNLTTIGKEIITAWDLRLVTGHKGKSREAKAKQEGAKQQPKHGEGDYDNRDELYYKLIKAVIVETELTAFVRLGKVQGAKPESIKPLKAEARRQGLSMDIIKASLNSSRALLLGNGASFKGLVSAFAKPALRANLNQRYDRALSALDAIDAPLDEAVKTKWQTVRKARWAINDLVTYLTETVALKAGMTFTFNELDGD